MECLKICVSFPQIVFIAVVARKTLKGRGERQRGATPLSTVDLGIVVVIIHCGDHEQNIYSPHDEGPLEIPKTK